MVRIQLRGLKRGVLFAFFLLSFIIQASANVDPYDDASEETNAAFRNAHIWVRNVYDKIIRGVPVSDIELNEHTKSINYLSHLKFEDIAIGNLMYAIEIRQKLPALLAET